MGWVESVADGIGPASSRLTSGPNNHYLVNKGKNVLQSLVEKHVTGLLVKQCC